MRRKVSVIIPNKNRAILLRETLDNLLNQTLKAHEIIVVDDGSTDEYPQVMEDYKGCVIFTNNPGKGPGAARNHGFNISTGYYIKYCDSDDVLTLNCLEVLANKAEETGKGIVYSPYLYASSSGVGQWSALDVVLTYSPVGNLSWHHYMAKGFFTSTNAMLFSREVIEKSGGWLPEMVYEDYEFLWRLTAIEPCPAHTNECCYFYRIHGNQTMGNQTSSRLRDEVKVRIFRKMYDDFKPGSVNYNPLTAAMLHAKIAETVFHKPPLPAELTIGFHTSIVDRLLIFYLRVENKIGRLKTRTNWQPYHGPTSNESIINHYLQLLK